MRSLFAMLFAVTLSGSAFAQNGGDRFCRQYSSAIADIAGEAIRRNPRCEDFSRGVHGNESLHYLWCMATPRAHVEGADEHIRRLVDRCSRNRPSRHRADALGRVWTVSEAGWTGTWTRIGNSNRFNAVWTHPSGGVVRADIEMDLDDDDVKVFRTDTAGGQVGNSCRYSGRIRGNQVSGRYDCDWGPGRHPWSAVIN